MQALLPRPAMNEWTTRAITTTPKPEPAVRGDPWRTPKPPGRPKNTSLEARHLISGVAAQRFMCGATANDPGLLRLTSALAIERNEKWMERRYLTMPQMPRSEGELRQPA